MSSAGASGNGVASVTAATGSTTTFKLADLTLRLCRLAAYQANMSWIRSPSAFLNAANATDPAGARRCRASMPPTRLCLVGPST